MHTHTHTHTHFALNVFGIELLFAFREKFKALNGFQSPLDLTSALNTLHTPAPWRFFGSLQQGSSSHLRSQQARSLPLLFLQSEQSASQHPAGVYSVTKSCRTLCDPMSCSPPGSSVHGISQARILEWIAISFSRGSS